MRYLIFSLLLALQSFAFEALVVDSTHVPTAEQVAECQQDARLYVMNLDLLTRKGQMTYELRNVSTQVQKSYGNFDMNCYYLKLFNTKAKEVIEKK
jgi:hypothetical protein